MINEMKNRKLKIGFVITLVLLSFMSMSLTPVQSASSTEVKTVTVFKHTGTLWSYRYYKLKVSCYCLDVGSSNALIYGAKLEIYTTTSGWLPPSIKWFGIGWEYGGHYWKMYSPTIYDYDSMEIYTSEYPTDYVYFPSIYITTQNHMKLHFSWFFEGSIPPTYPTDRFVTGNDIIYDAVDDDWTVDMS